MADTLRDAALAHSPGVAVACLTIVDNPHEAAQLMSRANICLASEEAALSPAPTSPSTAASTCSEHGPLPLSSERGHTAGPNRPQRTEQTWTP